MQHQFPSRLYHLIGHEYQCKRTQKGKAIEDVPDMVAEWEAQKAYVLPKTNGDFIVNGCLIPGPTRHREEWDVIRFTASHYFTFNGERIYMKFVNGYDPETGTFSTGDAFWQLFPLPEA